MFENKINKSEERIQKPVGFFQDDKGNKSLIRLLSFAVFLLLVMIDYIILKESYYSSQPYDKWFVGFMIGLNLVFLIAMFYPKYLQKIIELGATHLNSFKEALKAVQPSDLDKEKKPSDPSAGQ